jgi:hypothetical protein
MVTMELTEAETEQVRIMRLAPAEYAAAQRAKADARRQEILDRLPPDQRAAVEAERARVAALAPDVRRAEMLLRQKVAIEGQLGSALMAAVLADPEKVASLAADAQAEAAGFAMRGTIVKG